MRNRLVFAIVLVLILLAAAVPQFGTAHADEEGGEIYLQGATFDPVNEGPPITDFVPGNANDLYLVQFTGPVLEEWKAEVTSLGAKLYGYIPEYAFIARMDEETAAAVGELRSVRWVGDYEAAYRLDPALTVTRAAARDITLNVQTLPDADLAALTRQIRKLGGKVAKQGRNNFAGYLDVTLPSERVGELAAQDSVIWVEPDIAPELSNRVGGGQIMRTNSVRASLGLFGAGQVVAIADTGLDTGDANNLHADLSGRLIQAYCLGRPAPCNWNDTDGHGTHVAGSVLGSGVRSGSSPAAHFYSNSEAGTAPEAQYVFQSLLDPNGGLGGIPADDGQLMRQAYQHGARIHTNSWGANVNGVYTSDSQAVDQAAWELKDMLILFAAGNHGVDANPRNGVVDNDSLGAPGTAKNILSVGASENFYPGGVPAMCPTCPGGLGTFNPTWGDERFPMFPIWGDGGANNAYGMAPFSSRGPTDDGRIKPDIVAPGAWILSTLSRAADTTGWAPYNDHYYWLGGTSMATPLTAGGATLVREWLTRIQGVANPSAALMKALLLNGATDMAPGQYGFTQHQEVPWSRPNNVAGWGRADMVNTVAPPAPRRIWFTDPSNGLGTGDVAEYQVTITGPAYRGAEGEEAIPEGATGSVTLAGPDDSSDLGFDLDSEPVQAEEGASAPQGAQETRATNAQILQNTSFEFDS
ncbi:MAG TPA: S8 family serine peptidase, partial [Ardenticatenaceae bacterium]